MSSSTYPDLDKPEIGTGATMYVGSDRYPYTVIAVSKTGKKITLQADDTKRTDHNGMSEFQTWECTPNPEGHIRFAYRGYKGLHYYAGVCPVTFGSRRMYQDPSY